MIGIIIYNSTWKPNEGDYHDKVVLYTDNWNDWGYMTLFHIVYCDVNGRVHAIGSLKIYSRKMDEREDSKKSVMHYLPNEIMSLGSEFCSLGCDLNYYKNLKERFPSEYKKILIRLRDMATDEEIRAEFRNERGVEKSLLRESSAEKAMYEANSVLNTNKLLSKDISFKCKVGVPYSMNQVELSFNFKKDENLPYRINALVGKNGTGKTQILSQLANSLSGYFGEAGCKLEFVGKRPPIDRVMSISYSVFDGFKKVRGEDSLRSYIYCGIQTENGTLSLEQIQENFEQSYAQVVNRGRFKQWQKIISELLEKEHQDILTQIENEDFRNVNWSSGQHILISTMTELLANIENESLILFDEPEIHLHPNAIANVMRMFSSLLNEFDSYAIFATHSPIILQELPSWNVQVIEKIDNVIAVRNPLMECFGENISQIIADVFDVTEMESFHKQVFQNLSQEFDEDEVYEMFHNSLSMNAMIYLKTLYRGRQDD